MKAASYFTKDNGARLPVDDGYLLPFLTPTSPGTQYWESPPPGEIPDRVYGRVFLQCHQILDLMNRCGIDLRGKSLLDIGTGNGMIPRLLMRYSHLETAVGVDPYDDGGHATSWRKHDRDKMFDSLTEFIDTRCPGELRFDGYKDLVGHEHFSIRPAPVAYPAPRAKTFRFEPIGAHDLGRMGEQFDLFYCKAIDHIPDWNGIFRAIAAASSDDAVVLIKHFSFFSYLGPHRFAATNIPWGHVLLTDDEYRRFAHEHHGHRAEQMIYFYFNGLSYPRTPLSDLCRMARDNGFRVLYIENEPLRHIGVCQTFIDDVDGFFELAAANWPSLSTEEMFSGRYHLVFRRVGADASRSAQAPAAENAA